MVGITAPTVSLAPAETGPRRPAWPVAENWHSSLFLIVPAIGSSQTKPIKPMRFMALRALVHLKFRYRGSKRPEVAHAFLDLFSGRCTRRLNVDGGRA